VVWGDRVYLAQPEEFSASVVCHSRIDGRQLWRRDVSRIETSSSRSPSARLTSPSRCDATPVMDGKRLVVLMGSLVWCLDPEGRELWQRELTNRDPAGAPPASPVLWNGLCLVVLRDPARLEALDLSTGETRWALPLEKATAFGPMAGADELLMAGIGGFRAVHAASGKVAWTFDDVPASIRIEPTFLPGLALVPGTVQGFTALNLPRKGRPTIRWTNSAVGRVAGPGVALGGRVFVLNDAGEVVCLERRDGRIVGRRALPGAGAVSGNRIAPIVADGLLYLPDGSGAVTVLMARPSLDLVAVSTVGEPLSAAPAAAHGDLILRTESALWCLREGALPAD
jgi:outer membrane protein assembly factor BamB